MLPAVELGPGAEDNGLACMLADLVRQNLAEHPSKLRDFERLSGRVAIIVQDAGVSITLRFDRGRLRLYSGLNGIADMTIHATTDQVMQLSLVELVRKRPLPALPDPRGDNVRALAQASSNGSMKSFGMLPNLLMALRLTRVMSVHSG